MNKKKEGYLYENEVWKTYPEFTWIQGSSSGHVRTLDRVVPSGKGTRLVKGQILKQHLDKSGYLYVSFNVNGKVVHRKVHRLVAETFIPNPHVLPQVNHKDCDPTNNCVDNLEWCDASYNMQYREKYGVSNTDALGRPVFAINLATLEVYWFRSQGEASRVIGVYIENVNKVIKGKRKTTGGYWFTNADNNATKSTKCKLGGVVASKVEKLMNRNTNKTERRQT